MVDYDKLVQDGRLEEALEALQAVIRVSPGSVTARLRLIEVCCLLGRWDKAALHAEVVSEMDRNSYFKALRVLSLVRGEKERDEFLAGRALPSFMGEPPQWLVMLAESFRADALQPGSGSALRDKARALSPRAPGQRGATAFASFEDLHPYFGCALEVYVNAGYFWVPVQGIAELRVEPPRTHLDLVWARATLNLHSGSEVSAFIPVRYPGTLASKDVELITSRMTRWVRDGAGESPLGLRWFSLDSEELSLFELGQINFTATS